jgi:hypothetical protein
VRPWLCKIYYCKNYGPRVVEQGAESRLSRQCGGGVAQLGRDPRRAVAGEPSDAVEARGLKRFDQRHGPQNRGESPGQHRRARSRGAEQGDIMGITTVFGLPEHATLDDVPVHGRPLTPPRPARLTALYPAGPA